MGMPGVGLISAERTRQVATLEYDTKHDVQHGVGGLVTRAGDYLDLAETTEGYEQQRNITKAGAILAAALDLITEQKENTYE